MFYYHLAVKKVGSHEKLEGNLRRNWELRDLSGGVGVPDYSSVKIVEHNSMILLTPSPGLVCEVHAHFLENMAWDFAEVHLSCDNHYHHVMRQFYLTSFVSFSANWPGPESIA